MDDRKEWLKGVDRNEVQKLELQGLRKEQAELLYKSGELRIISSGTFALGNAHIQDHKIRAEAVGEEYQPCSACKQGLRETVIGFEGVEEVRGVAEGRRADEERRAASARANEWSFGDAQVSREDEV